METTKLSIVEQLQNFFLGKYDEQSTAVQIQAGWYDWFCKDELLYKKTKALYGKLQQIIFSKRIQQLGLENVYVFFKNNCPVNGSLYDDFRICSIETGNVIYTIVPKCGHKSSKGLAEIWGKENEFKEPLFKGTWNDAKKFFNNHFIN